MWESGEWLTVWVFISSTFLDMNAERQMIVKNIFPALNLKAKKHRVRFVAIDLRWGLTKEDTSSSGIGAVELCLRQIERSRPLIIALQGSRYGWRPEVFKTSDAEFEWASTLAPHSISITHLELKQAFMSTTRACIPLCYLRDESIVEGLDPEIFSEPNEASRKQLQSLRKELEEKWNGRVYTLNLKNLSGYTPLANDLDALLSADMLNLLKEGFPIKSIDVMRDSFAIENANHNALIETRVRFFVGRATVLQKIESLVNWKHGGAKGMLCIVGRPGSGKTAVLAKFTLAFSKQNTDVVVVPHFVGVSPSSTLVPGLLRRIIGEIQKKFGMSAPIPDTLEELEWSFPTVLAEAASKSKKLLIVIDALNQMNPAQGAHSLNWLPLRLPDNVFFVVSTLEGAALTSLRMRSPPVAEILLEKLSRAEQEEVVRTVLRDASKRLSEEQLSVLLAKEEAHLPLFLVGVCEELRISADFNTLDVAIASLPGNVVDLFGHMLQRLEGDHGGELVRDSFCLIFVSRHGLHVSELLELLAPPTLPMLPFSVWARLFHHIEPYFRPSGEGDTGVLDFFHRQFAKAVERRYLSTDQLKKVYFLKLATYFGNTALSERRVEQQPYYLVKLEDWAALKEFVSQPDVFLSLISEKNKFELLSYWHRLQECPEHYNAAQVYRSVINAAFTEGTTTIGTGKTQNPAKSGWDTLLPTIRAAKLLTDGESAAWSKFGQTGAKQIITDIDDDGEDDAVLETQMMRSGERQRQETAALTVLHSRLCRFVASLLIDLSQIAEARDIAQMALEKDTKAFGAASLSASADFSLLGRCEGLLGNAEKAAEHHKRAIEIRKEQKGENHPLVANSLEDLALVGDYQGSAYGQQALEITVKNFGPTHAKTLERKIRLLSVIQQDFDGVCVTVKSSEAVFGFAHPLTAHAYTHLARLFAAERDEIQVKWAQISFDETEHTNEFEEIPEFLFEGEEPTPVHKHTLTVGTFVDVGVRNIFRAGIITKLNADGTYTVNQGGSDLPFVEIDRIRPTFFKFDIPPVAGTPVRAIRASTNSLATGVVESVSGDKVVVKYDRTEELETLELSQVGKIPEYDGELFVGLRLEVNWKNGGVWYAGFVQSITNGLVDFRFDDNDFEAGIERKRMRATNVQGRTSLQESTSTQASTQTSQPQTQTAAEPEKSVTASTDPPLIEVKVSQNVIFFDHNLGIWCPGSVLKVDGDVTVQKEGGTEVVVPLAQLRSESFAYLSIGQRVQGNWKNYGKPYRGTISCVYHVNNTADIKYDDGDFEGNVDAVRIILTLPKSIKVGSYVLTERRGNGRETGTVTQIYPNGDVGVAFGEDSAAVRIPLCFVESSQSAEEAQQQQKKALDAHIAKNWAKNLPVTNTPMQANWKQRGTLYAGKIDTVVSTDPPIYNIQYDDGDYEENVPLILIFPTSTTEAFFRAATHGLFAAGDAVFYQNKQTQRWEVGKILGNSVKELYSVRFDDGHFQSGLERKSIKKPFELAVGKPVVASHNGQIRRGVVKSNLGNGAVEVEFESDASGAACVVEIPINAERASSSSTPLPVGTIVRGNWKGHGTLYNGKIAAVSNENSVIRYEIAYTDGDYEKGVEPERVMVSLFVRAVMLQIPPPATEVACSPTKSLADTIEKGIVTRALSESEVFVRVHSSGEEVCVSLNFVYHAAEWVDLQPTEKLAQGERIGANWKNFGKFLSGVIAEVREENSFWSIRSSSGEVIDDVPPSLVCAIDSSAAKARVTDGIIRRGERVQANWKARGTLYPGKIARVNADKTYNISYDDGDREVRVPGSRIFQENGFPFYPPLAPPVLQPGAAKSGTALSVIYYEKSLDIFQRAFGKQHVELISPSLELAEVIAVREGTGVQDRAKRTQELVDAATQIAVRVYGAESAKRLAITTKCEQILASLVQ
eukprot:TRINITY_DN4730_c0_g1_i5.p1 TRINITY_DN4730_c0_g1~~TRINITY_DN4730_c0_g1_i5.p1  ORF type:complete len:1994 (-),score=527.85 TRINITY_DN4730_c0_g1_i5:24-5759(-)